MLGCAYAAVNQFLSSRAGPPFVCDASATKVHNGVEALKGVDYGRLVFLLKAHFVIAGCSSSNQAKHRVTLRTQGAHKVCANEA
jgi:hypothetical protein